MKILYITTVGSTMDFFVHFIKKLTSEGHTVDIAGSAVETLPSEYADLKCQVFPLDCTRSPFNKGTLRAIGQIRDIVSHGGYDIVHCHTPVASFCTRIACRNLRKNGLKVIYTAHGFHFYKGAPLKNWLFYYPAELFCSKFTDVLITINTEDYMLAKSKMHAQRVEYVPGVGIDTDKFTGGKLSEEEYLQIRNSLGFHGSEKLILSVGELNANKNHRRVIEAIAGIGDKNLHYVIAGTGAARDELIAAVAQRGVKDNLHLLGFRQDINTLLKISDLFILPSLREGLPVALMEAMASKCPAVCSDIRGPKDLIKQGLFNPLDVKDIKSKILWGLTDGKNAVEENYKRLEAFKIDEVETRMMGIYKNACASYS